MTTEISPTPTDEEAAAVMAATEALWPRPVAFDDSADNPRREPVWRFSARWWARPIATRRARPHH